MNEVAPAYRGPVLHFDALRLVALLEEGWIEKTRAAEYERELLITRTCASTLSPRSSLLLEHSLQPTPSPVCKLA